jgi:hypothetical protein
VGNDLWTHGGKHVGRRTGDDIFSPLGLYLGEVMPNQRLITDNSKAARRNGAFTASASRTGQDAQAKIVTLALSMGYQDFPHADTF